MANKEKPKKKAAPKPKSTAAKTKVKKPAPAAEKTRKRPAGEPSAKIMEQLANANSQIARSQAQISKLEDSLQTLASDLDEVRTSLQGRKRETTTLKILFYTALLVLLIGFLYSSSTLQKAQLESLETNMAALQDQLSQDLALVEKTLYGEIENLKFAIETLPREDLEMVLARMKTAVSHLEPDSESMAILIDQIKQNSDGLSLAYREYKEIQPEEPPSLPSLEEK